MRARPGPAIAIAVFVAFSLWITWRAKAIESRAGGHTSTSALLNKPAPDFSLRDTADRTVSLADYRGRNVVVTFWASWCGPCRMEMPVLRTFYEKARKSGNDFELLAINIDQSPDDGRTAAAGFKLPFPVLMDSSSRVANAYGVDAIPALFVIDSEGKVKYSVRGFDLGLDLQLASQLGLQDYSPLPGTR